MRKASVLMPPLAVLSLMSMLALLVACESAPRPPEVDEARKRPVNSATALSLQMCKNELHNTRLLASETVLREEATRAGVERLVLQNQLLALSARTAPAPKLPPTPPAVASTGSGTGSAETAAGANRIYTLQFGYASTQIDLNADFAKQLVSHAKAAPLVLLRGRTDGLQDNAADSRIARARADVVRQWLVASGVDPARIRSTHQPAGDHLADNSQATGRASNRRVEIEIYRAAPVRLAAAAPVQP